MKKVDEGKRWHGFKDLLDKKRLESITHDPTEESKRKKKPRKTASDGLPFQPLRGDTFGKAACRACLRVASLQRQGPRAWQRWLAEQSEEPYTNSEAWAKFVIDEMTRSDIRPTDYPNSTENS